MESNKEKDRRILLEEEARQLASTGFLDPLTLPPLDDHEPSTQIPESHDDGSFESHVLLREDSLVEETSHTTQRQHGSSLHTNRQYRIHFGTRPGSYPVTYKECEKRHKKLIILLSQIRAKLEDLQMKQFLFKILHSNAISTTETWAVEPYACIIFESCSLEMVEGVAAIIGRILRQDGIGIFHDGEDYQDHQLGKTVDEFYYVHRFFAISRSDESHEKSISNHDAKQIMKAIRKEHRDLSGQFGKSNETIELHDFGNVYNTETIQSLQTIVGNIVIGQNRYRIEENRVNSRLLLEEEYSAAIKEAEFELLALFIEATHEQGTLYPPIRVHLLPFLTAVFSFFVSSLSFVSTFVVNWITRSTTPLFFSLSFMLFLFSLLVAWLWFRFDS